jgi:hypothetical protein
VRATLAGEPGRRVLSPTAFDRGVRCANGGRESSNEDFQYGFMRAKEVFVRRHPSALAQVLKLLMRAPVTAAFPGGGDG